MPASLIRAGQYVLTAIFILGPLAVVQPGKVVYNSLDTPRRLFLMLGAGLLAALILRAWSLRRRIVIRRHVLDGAVLLYFLMVVVSSIGGVYWRISFLGPLWMQDSLPLLVTAVCLYFGVKEFIRTPDDLERFVLLIGVVGGIAAAYGLFEWGIIGQPYREILKNLTPLNQQVAAGLLNPRNEVFQSLLRQKEFLESFSLNMNFLGWRLSSTLGNPMFTGAYFAMTLPVAAGAALAARRLDRRILLGACTTLMLFALLLTQTRAAWIGFALSVPFVGVLGVLQLRKTHAVISSIVMIIAAVSFAGTLAVGLSTPQLRARLYSVVNMEDATVKTRRVYMESALNIFKHYPIQGAGYGNIKAIFPQHRPTSTVLESGLPLNRGYCTSLPHNIILQTAAESGLMGLLPFLLLAVLIFMTGFSLLRGEPEQAWLSIGLLGGFTAYYITNLFSFDNAATLAQFWTFAGLLAGVTAADRTLPPRYGSLAAPLTRNLASMFNIACLVVGLGAVLSFGIQMTSAHTLQQSIQRMARADEILAASQNPPDAKKYKLGCQIYDNSIRDIEGIIKSSLVPDSEMYKVLFMAYRGRHAYSPQGSLEEQNLRKQEYRIAETTLKIFDREPIVLRYYIVELKDSPYPNDYRLAYEMAKRLIEYEPRSSEARMLLAQALQSLEDYPRAILAAKQAVELDDISPNAYGLLGQLYYCNATEMKKTNSVTNADAIKDNMLNAIKNYDQVFKYDADLLDNDRFSLILALLYTGQPDRAVAEAHKLRNNAVLDTACTGAVRIYQERGKPEEGKRVAEAMRAAVPVPPAAPTTPAPAPTPMFGPQPFMPGVPR